MDSAAHLLGPAVIDERTHLIVRRVADLIANAEALLIYTNEADSSMTQFTSPTCYRRMPPRAASILSCRMVQPPAPGQ